MKVTFLPFCKEIEVEEGVTLLEAAEEAGVYINSLCGGQGLCGECSLQVKSGNAKADKHAIGFFSGEAIQSGYVLACHTEVKDNLEVLVPAKSRLEMEKIVTEGAPVTYSEPGKMSLCKIPRDPASLFEPLVSKLYLELPKPTLSDNVSDLDREGELLCQETEIFSSTFFLVLLPNNEIESYLILFNNTNSIGKFSEGGLGYD